METAHERWLRQEEERKQTISDLNTEKTELRKEIDRVRTINPYYPIHTMASRMGAIAKKLKRMEGYEKRFL